jgi:excisionase family DNA binding protein
MTAPRLTLRMPEVAEQLGVGLSTVQRWTASGQLVSVRVGGVVLITPADLDAFLASHREGKGVAPRTRR